MKNDDLKNFKYEAPELLVFDYNTVAGTASGDSPDGAGVGQPDEGNFDGDGDGIE